VRATLYIDAIFAIGINPKDFLLKLDKLFPKKPNSISVPEYYLGGKLTKVTLEKHVEAWAFSASKYVKEACCTIEKSLTQSTGQSLPKRANTPLPTAHHQGLDISEELSNDVALIYRSYLGILWWIRELGRMDIITELSCYRHMYHYQGRDTSRPCTESLHT
jgi:hypothetical protein